MLPKISACKGDFDETKQMSFLIKNDEFLEKYEIWEKVSNSIKKDLIVNLCTVKNIIEKFYEGKINTQIFTMINTERRFAK